MIFKENYRRKVKIQFAYTSYTLYHIIITFFRECQAITKFFEIFYEKLGKEFGIGKA